MTPAERAELDRRIAFERFDELPVHETRPEWAGHFDIAQPKVWTMDLAGVVSPSWRFLDEISWVGVAAIWLETVGGARLDTLAWNDGDIDEDDFE